MIQRFFILCPLVSLSLLAGCVSAPTPSAKDKAWSPPADAQKPDRVWPEVRSNSIAIAKPMTLPELVDFALRNNPASRIAWLDARAAAEQVTKAQGYFMPEVSASLGASRTYVTTEPEQTGQMQLGSDHMKYGPGLQVNYLVLNFGGGRQAAVEQALQTVYAADFAFNRTIQTILLNVESAYYGLISANAAVEAAEAGVRDAQTVLQAAEERNNSGMGTQLEVLQAQTGLDQARFVLAAANGQFMIARGNLSYALNLPADTLVKVIAPAQEIPEPLAEQNLRQMIDDALRRRPDIAALRAQSEARQAAVKVAKASDWPNLFLNGGIGRNYYDNYGDNPLQDSDWAATAGASLQWTLFSGFQTRSEKRIATTQAEAALEQLKQAELAASTEVWARFHVYKTALEKYSASAALLKSATGAHALALESYKAGLKSILDLLSAESQLAQARSQQIAARQEVFTALANLAYATGLLEKDGGRTAPNLKP